MTEHHRAAAGADVYMASPPAYPPPAEFARRILPEPASTAAALVVADSDARLLRYFDGVMNGDR